MEPRKDKKHDQEQKKTGEVQTPPPPQVLDPSVPPGQGQHETYDRGDGPSENRKGKGKDKG